MIVKQTENSIHESVGVGGNLCKATIYMGKPFYKNDHSNKTEPWKSSDPASTVDNKDSVVYDRLPIEVTIFKNEKIGYQIRCKKTGGMKRVTLLKINDVDVSKKDLGKLDLPAEYKFSTRFDVGETGVRLWKRIMSGGPSSLEWLVEDDRIGEFKFRDIPEAFDLQTGAMVVVPTKRTDLDSTSFLFREDIGATSGIDLDIDFAYSGGGHVWGYGAYATARATGYAYNNLSFTVGQSLSGTYVVYRSFLKFDTSSVTAIPSQVNMKGKIAGITSDFDFDVDVVKYDWSGVDPISGGIDTAYDGCLAATKDATWFNSHGKVVSATIVHTSQTLDTSWVEVGSTTYYGLRSFKDFANTAPSGNEYIAVSALQLDVFWSFSANIILI